MIPKNISRHHILKAIEDITVEGISDKRDSTKFDLIYQEKAFPPKLVLSRANFYANGEELDPSKFSGGDESNTFLSALEFEIVPKEPAKRNPAWQRDELILALDLYFRHHPKTISQTHPEVIRLSEILNQLPIHTARPDAERFRNLNSVYMKLCNFLRFDPEYSGTGLSAGGKADEEIWREFSSNRDELRKLAELITETALSSNLEATLSLPDDRQEEEEFPEGKLLYRLHRTRERNRELIRKAKDKRKREVGVLNCDVCGFDFFQCYGSIGSDYIECHHTKPVSELKDGEKTNISDIALVCANCHRMLHRKRPWLSIQQLKDLLNC
ncbi:HNH endonuclease [Leptolyngbya sp. GB1-A1]|uniref:HNH endonuclease n=1 Tax=Leptolyngbya sp. GB1-A1 TaxID=2933908 RepID=UPI003297B5D0